MDYSFSENLDPVDVADRIVTLIEKGLVKKSDSYKKIQKLVNKYGIAATENDIKEIYIGRIKGYKQIIQKKLEEFDQVEPSEEDVKNIQEADEEIVEDDSKKKEVFKLLDKKYKEKKIVFNVDSVKSVYKKFKDEVEIEKKKFKDLILEWYEITSKKLESTTDTKEKKKEKKEKKDDIIDTDMEKLSSLSLMENLKLLNRISDIQVRLSLRDPKITEKEKNFYYDYKKKKKEEEKKRQIIKKIINKNEGEGNKEVNKVDEDDLKQVVDKYEEEKQNINRKIIRKKTIAPVVPFTQEELRQQLERSSMAKEVSEDFTNMDIEGLIEDIENKQDKEREVEEPEEDIDMEIKRTIFKILYNLKDEEEIDDKTPIKTIYKKVLSFIDFEIEVDDLTNIINEWYEKINEDYIVEVFTSKGTLYIYKSKLEKKAAKDKVPEPDTKAIKKFKSEIDMPGFLAMRSSVDFVKRKNENKRGYMYCEWVMENPNATTKDHLKKISSLGLLSVFFNTFLGFGRDKIEAFASMIIQKYKSQEDLEIQNWTFYEELSTYTRKNLKNTNIYIEKVRTFTDDFEKEKEFSEREAEIFGDDIDDLVDEEDDEESYQEQEEYEEEKQNRSINDYINEFFDEYVIESKGNKITLDIFTKSFITWLYKSYPSERNFPALTIRNTITNKIGKNNIEIVRKTNNRIINVVNKKILKTFTEEEEKNINEARNFINLASTYDIKSKLFLSFHLAAYKETSEDKIDDLVESYNVRFLDLVKEKFPEDFIEEYKKIWNLNLNKKNYEKLINITPFVQNYLKRSTKILRNPLSPHPSRRKNRLRLLMNEDAVTDKLLAKLPYSISNTAKECLMWHQTKPWWNLDYKYDKIIIASAEGLQKDKLPENIKIFFGDFVHLHYIDDTPYYFYTPSRMYNLLLCHLNYTNNDIVQCKVNMDDSITISTDNNAFSIYTGIYNSSPNRDESFSLVTKEMYDKECEWWKTRSYSPIVMINKIKKIMMNEENKEVRTAINIVKYNLKTRLEKIFPLETFKYDSEKLSNDLVEYMLKNKNISISKFLYDYEVNFAPIDTILFYPSKILGLYISLWREISPDYYKIIDLINIPRDYKYLEVYSHPEIEKREILKQIIDNELTNRVDDMIVSIHNQVYLERPKIRSVNGRKIGYYSDVNPMIVTLDNSKTTIFKDTFVEGNNIKYFLNEKDFKDINKYILVKGEVTNEEGEEQEQLFLIDMRLLYDIYDSKHKEDYYTYRQKNKSPLKAPYDIVSDEYIDLKIPSNIVKIVHDKIREQLNKKYNFSYSFDEDLADLDIKCGYCKRHITSADNVYKTYEQTKDEETNMFLNELVFYCSSDCFNNSEEEVVPDIKNTYEFYRSDEDMKNKITRNFMLKVVRENNISEESLYMSGLRSREDLIDSINNNQISLYNFKQIVGPKIIAKYKDLLYYIRED